MVPHLGSTAGDARGVSGFIQLGVNDSRTMIATRYFGLGVTAFGVIPGRPIDSLGAGFAWSRLNRNLRPDETLFQFYDQIQICGGFYLQPALTLSPNPGEKTARAPAIAFTVQSTVLF
jgi:porin